MNLFGRMAIEITGAPRRVDPAWFDNLVSHPFLASLAKDVRSAGLGAVATLRFINREVNAFVAYRRDAAGDAWNAPLVTLKSRAGDCEDIAIVKLAALRAAQFPGERQLAVVSSPELTTLHAVLTAQAGGGTWVLDNRVRGISRDTDTRYRPLAAYDADTTWAFAA